MLPGITPFLGSSFPPLSAVITPNPGDYSGTLGNYTASFSVGGLNGSGSYSFLWSAPGVSISSGQGTATVNLFSASGVGTTVSVTVTDFISGQTVDTLATLNSVSGGGGT